MIYLPPRYWEVLQGAAQQQEAGRLKAWVQAGGVLFLTAVKNLGHSYVSMWREALGMPFARLDANGASEHDSLPE
ncbi:MULTISPECIES: hypothetical protein [Neisseria]|uniref:hypothetical protein n=1 Tax=Neisseria TaxID=482 RepID=UPI00164B73D4|nr:MULTISPECIES: hypothetical protein [Neisseria]